MTRFDGVWEVLDGQVGAGRFPGYAAAVRAEGETGVRVHGRTAVEADAPRVTEGTQFRIASVTKPIGAVLTLNLVEAGVLTLEDDVARWLPEAAHPTVLPAIDAPLDSATPTDAKITVRHLLNGTSGWGCVMDPGPLQSAMTDRGVSPSALARPIGADDFVAGVCGLPLAFEPGTRWLYETGIDLLGVLLTRATGQSLATLLTERILTPLGMGDTGFTGDPARLAAQYLPTPDGALELIDPPDGVFAHPVGFEELSSGLVSTVGDVLAFYTAMADGGAGVVTPESLARITEDQLTKEQRAGAFPLLTGGESWGLGTSVDAEVDEPWRALGRWGWTGGTGTTAYVDPTRHTVCVLLTQRAMAGPDDTFDAFCAAVAATA